MFPDMFQGNSRRSDGIAGTFQNYSEESLKVQEVFQDCFRGSHGVSAGFRGFQQDSEEFQAASKGISEVFYRFPRGFRLQGVSRGVSQRVSEVFQICSSGIPGCLLGFQGHFRLFQRRICRFREVSKKRSWGISGDLMGFQWISGDFSRIQRIFTGSPAAFLRFHKFPISVDIKEFPGVF